VRGFPLAGVIDIQTEPFFTKLFVTVFVIHFDLQVNSVIKSVPKVQHVTGSLFRGMTSNYSYILNL